MHNTHIIRLGFEPEEVQIEKLPNPEPIHTCIYPRPLYLREVVDPLKYATEPYKLCLALGEPQLAYRVFDLSVLEAYRNDPRYYYSTDDIRGQIYIKSEGYESPQFPRGTRFFLKRLASRTMMTSIAPSQSFSATSQISLQNTSRFGK